MRISTDLIKKLREETGAGIIDCREALTECKGNLKLARDYLRKKGLEKLAKKRSRVAKEGLIDAYIHANGKIGVLIEVNCETDFVARNEVFRDFVHDLALQVAASNPLYIKPEDVPEEVLEKEKEFYRVQAVNEGKPEKVIEKIVEGKLKKFYEETCLLEQSFIKNPEIKIKDYLGEVAGKLGENIVIRRFVRYVLGEGFD
jgi:elongation factor Ts